MPLPSQHNQRYGHLNVSRNVRAKLLADGVPKVVVDAFAEMDRNHHPLSNAFHHQNPKDDGSWRSRLNVNDPKPDKAPNWDAMLEYAELCLKHSKVVHEYFQNPVTEQALAACMAMTVEIKAKDWASAWYHKTAYMDALVLFSWRHWDATTAGNDNPKWGRYEGEQPRNKWKVTIYPDAYLGVKEEVSEPIVSEPTLSNKEKLIKARDLINEVLNG